MIDTYTKVVLTIIAIALMTLAIRPYTLPKDAWARDVVDVRIVGIDTASSLGWQSIQVACVYGCAR
jgi:hypothetical protein